MLQLAAKILVSKVPFLETVFLKKNWHNILFYFNRHYNFGYELEHKNSFWSLNMLDIYLQVYGLFTLETDTGLSLVSAENLFGDTKLRRGLSTIKHHSFTRLSRISGYLIP